MDRQAIAVIVANALIWAAVLVGAAYVLDGSGCWSQASTVLGGGAAASVIVVGGGVRQIAND